MQENTSRLLIVEATDNEWKADSVPDNYADMIGVQTTLQVSQSAHGGLDEHGIRNVRVPRVSSPVGDSSGNLPIDACGAASR